MKIYLDTNVFYNAYCPVENADIADWILEQLSTDLVAVTSEWTIAEMFRAIKKQVNLEAIDEGAANIIIDFFISEIKQFSNENVLILSPVDLKSIQQTRFKIFNFNLYSSDALHAVTAENYEVTAFISFDSDFAKYLNIPVLNPSDPKFDSNLEEIAS